MASWLSTYKSKRKSRKRKANKEKMTKHMAKHPKYYNQALIDEYNYHSLMIIFYLMLLSIKRG